ncbi:OprD family outer membrane porin [Vibrio sp. WXL103]|uniref:OprD family outer membrane porin n=1 Tax=Vibrio sp. WXL103 TaxID=3450710 RepID=UPI003EC7D38B
MRSYTTSRYTAVAALVSSVLATPALANIVQDSTLNLQLRNEYRNADRPSADDGIYGPKIDAWVQGFLFDFESGKLADTISVNGGLYHIEKLRADPDKVTRFYLDGHDSFTIPYGNIAFDFSDYAHLTIGQFGTDYYYGSLEYLLPLIDESSARTTPTLREGAFYEGKFGDFNLYGMYVQREAGGYNTGWTDTGRVVGLDLDTLEMIIDESPIYAISGLWDNKKSHVAVTLQHQEDVADQVASRGSHSWLNQEGNYFKLEYSALYAQLIGDSKDANRAVDNGSDDTFGVSTQLTYNQDRATFVGSIGYVGHKLASNDVDSDIGFSFDQSIDRNGHKMTAWQMGGFYQVQENLNVGLAVVVTDGYKNANEDTTIEGLGANLIVMHTAKSGPLAGLRSALILNKAQEYRITNGINDTLDYYDIKFTGHYDIKLF